MGKKEKMKSKFYRWLIPAAALIFICGCGKQEVSPDSNGIWKSADLPAVLSGAEMESARTEIEYNETDQSLWTSLSGNQIGEEAVDLETPSKTGLMVAIDAGHQSKGNSEKEPIGPGAAEMKAKVAGGTSGVASGVPEYQLTLDVSLRLRDELQARGYEVYMVRETNEANISNAERALLAADAGADLLIRIHANGSENSSAKGIMTICPTAQNPYCGAVYAGSRSLAEKVLHHMLAQTGAESKGVWETDTMSGINWSAIPVTIVEMGFMSNPEEDMLMQTDQYQDQLVQGMADGIDAYFAEQAE